MRKIKSIIKEAGSSLTEVAQMLSDLNGKPYSVQNLSKKMRLGTLKYDEALQIFELLGYEIKIEKKVENKK